MLGAIQLVNPDRGSVWAAKAGRLTATTADGGANFEVRCFEEGVEFWPGRQFSRHELEAFAAGEPLSAEELAVVEGHPEEDDLGRVPATRPDPAAWRWYGFTVGEVRLRKSARPSLAEFAAVASEALKLEEAETLPWLDPWELWVCDKETGEPLALAITADSREQAETITYSPRWRFCVASHHTPETKQFEDRVNDRLNSAETAGRFRFATRLVFRRPNGSALEYSQPHRDDPPIERPVGWLPRSHLAEPWEGERLRLKPLLES